MSLSHFLNIVTNGLVLYLDAANPKSYNSSENLLTYSEEFDNIIWSKSNSSITTNQAIAPDNTLTADLWIPNLTSDSRLTTQSVKPNNTYTLSFYVKSAGLTVLRTHMLGRTPTDSPSEFVVEFNLSTGTASFVIIGNGVSASIKNVGNGWFRCICVYTKTGSSTDLETRIGQYNTGDGTSGFYFWGAQLENGSTVSKYTITTNAAITRSTSWLDISNNNIANGTISSGFEFDNKNSGGIIFNGTSSTCSLTDNSATRFPHDSAWSISLWCKPITQNITYPGFLIKGNSILSGVLIYYTAAGIYWKHNATDLQITTTDLGVTKNICLTYAGSGSVNRYVNGVNVGTVGTMVSTETSSTLILGSGDQLGNVEIYNFAKYNTALSATDVLQNYNALRGRYGV